MRDAMHSKERFTNRAADYDQWRPRYPARAVDFIVRALDLRVGSALADLGAGTGIFSRLLADAGFAVAVVEPNEDMMARARDAMGAYPETRFFLAPAEATEIASGSVDAAVAAQSFHWFDLAAVREELIRIVKPPHPFAGIWNVRRTDSTPFLHAYHDFLLRWGTDYEEIHQRQENAGDSVRNLFADQKVVTESFDNVQEFDYQGLEGRLLSCSFVPRRNDPNFDPMLEDLRRLFAEYATENRVAFEYDCRVYAGFLSDARRGS